MTMTRDELLEIVKELRGALEVVLCDEARRHTESILFRVLNMNDDDLRNRVRDQIRTIVREEVGKHLDVSVNWR